MTSDAGFWVKPIGVVRSPFVEPRQAPRQARLAEGVTATLELFEGRGYEFAVEDLTVGQHLWILFWFHRALGEKLKVLPPRSSVRRGVFSTRAPYRPNPIGMSVVRLVAIDGLRLELSGVDLLDGTPVLDIKPYLPYADALPDADSGWLSAPDDPGPRYRVELSERAREQLRYLAEQWHTDLRAGIEQALVLGPQPHPYRRIKRDGDAYRLAHKEWRVRFTVDGELVRVLSIATGYRAKELFGSTDAELEAHRQFVERYGFPGHTERAR